jgi:flagellar biosynthesis chaperone FliJ
MKQAAIFALLGIMSVLPGLAQTSQTDSQTLRDILVEMRAIHDDVRLSETTQILLTELGVQRGVVDKAMQKRDDVRTNVSQVQANMASMTTQLANLEDNPNAPTDPVQKARAEQMQQQFKIQIPMLKQQIQDLSNVLQDAESSLRKEQDTLSGIQDELNEVVKKLQPVNSK